MRRSLLLLAALVPAAASLAAQGSDTVRAFTTSRQLHGETRLTASVEVAGGTLRILPGAPGDLYRMRLVYDPARFLPLSGYQAADQRVRLGVAAANGAPSASAGRAQIATVEFSPMADLDLAIALGSAETTAELGGLRLAQLAVATGASPTTVRFDRPNPIRCRYASFMAGAAELRLIGLGNARCDSLRLQGGVGQMTVDFRGAGPARSHLDLKLAVGEVVLQLPRSLGVRLSLDRILSTFRPAGLTRRGSAYLSDNYDRAAQRLDIDVQNAVGGVRIEWVD